MTLFCYIYEKKVDYTFIKKHIQELIEISDAEIEEFVVPFFKKINLRKHQYLIQEGQNITFAYLVEEGLLKQSFWDTDGKEYIIQFAGPNWWIADMGSYYKDIPAKWSVDCLKDVTLWGIPFKEVDILCDRLPKMERFFRMKGNLGYLSLQHRILSLLNENAKDRFENFVKKYPDLYSQLSKQHIASYLGLSRETLSRL